MWYKGKELVHGMIISIFPECEKVIREQIQPGVPYPFPTLNFMTYGIRTSESVLITAQEGVGKTEVMHAIEHQILTQTEDSLGAIFLEEPKRRHLQALAGIHPKHPCHLPDANITNEETIQAIQNVVRVDERLHIYSHFGSDDPEIILDTIRFLVSARGCRYILL